MKNINQSNKSRSKFYDYPDIPVAQESKKSQLNIALVTTGMSVAMSTLYTGAALAEVMTYKDGITSIIIGCCVLAIVAIFTGNIATEQGVSTSMLARHPFGRRGSNIVGLVLALSMLGWFAYQCGYFGDTIELLFPNSFFTKAKVATIWGGLLMMSTAIIGYKGMTYLSILASPLLFGLCLYSGLVAISQVGLPTIMEKVPTSSPAGIGVGITIVVGGWITGAVLQPDISRYANSKVHNTRGVLIAMIVFGVANWGGFVIAKATAASTIMDGLNILGIGGLGLIIVILGQWTSNDNNLYSASLAIININPKANKHVVCVICGILFTLLAVTGIQNHFVGFLSLLGTFLPPIGSVLVADYYILNKNIRYKFDDKEKYVNYKPVAIICVIVGGVLAYLIPFGARAINAIVITFVIYLIMSNLFKTNK